MPHKRCVTWLVLLLVLALMPLVCSAQDSSEEPETSPAPKQSDDTVKVPLSDRLRFVVRPTIFGLVPPPDPANFGEVFVRVREVNPDGSVGLYYEIKEEITVKRDDEEKKSRRKPKPQTIIRRGLITAQRSSGNSQILPPLFWQDGDFQTNASLLWISNQKFSALKLTAKASWDIAAAEEMPQWAKAEYQQVLENLAGSQTVQTSDSAVVLNVVDDSASYPIIVNGARIRLPAIKVRDSLGFAEYWILDDPLNPLVLKLTYISGQMPGSAANSGGYSIFSGGGFAIVGLSF